MATQVEQVLNFGKLEDKAKNSDLKKHPPSQLLRQVLDAAAKIPENQPLVDELVRFGRGELSPVVKNSPHLAAKVNPRHDYSALQHENQHIFDEVVDRGGESFRSDQWKEGVRWVQAAKASPDTDVVVKSEEEAESLKRAVDKEEISEVNQMLQKERETADAVAGDTRKSVCRDAESLKDQCAGDQTRLQRKRKRKLNRKLNRKLC
ncbi:hypothetical protein PsorP6_018876 [Peronosclerospora sorghi]|nr:hypothetical protein PsorP6_018876 [Peronosclerospora sorghi]